MHICTLLTFKRLCSLVLGNQVEKLEETKKNKDLEIEKYKKYLNKAKKIIESFGETYIKTPAEDNIEVSMYDYVTP